MNILTRLLNNWFFLIFRSETINLYRNGLPAFRSNGIGKRFKSTASKCHNHSNRGYISNFTATIKHSNYKATSLVSKYVIGLLALLFLTQSCSVSKKIVNTTPDDRGFLIKLNDKAPNFDMEFTDGTNASLKDYKGKPVMLQFTASWCGVCIKEMPHIEDEIWQKWKDDGLIVIGVDRDEPLEKALSLIDKTGVTYPIALDPGAEIYKKFAAEKSGVTRNVIIDKNGKVVFLTRLFNLEEFEAMKQKIQSLL